MNRKELIRQYKQTIPSMGVYQIRCTLNQKVFVGSTKNLHGKKNSYHFQLDMGSHMNKALQQEYNVYGSESFVFEVLDTVTPKDDLKYDYSEDLATLESLWLQKLEPYGTKGYNNPPKS